MALSRYDFVVVGGGTAGLVVASRLSENPSQQVLVLEAGSDASDDPRVKTPGLCMSLPGSDVDWGFNSTPQPHLNDRVVGLKQGKALGGSSSINFQVYVPPVPAVIDSWESPLGNTGWNSEALRPYFYKAFTSPPVVESLDGALGIDGWTERTSTHGPVRIEFPGDPQHPIRKVWADTFRGIGHYVSHDPFVNASVGGFSSYSSVDPTTQERSSSVTAYYHPIKSRKNLQVLTNASVEKVLLEEGRPEGQAVKATGVLYRHSGELKKVCTNKEVIIAAGALQTPKILEVSGIGNRKILEQHGITAVVDLPGVGENLHDHLMCSMSFAAVDDLETFDAFFRQEPEAVKDATERYARDGSGPLASLGVYTCAYLPVLDHISQEGRERLIQLLEANRPDPSQGTTTPAEALTQAYYRMAETSLLDPTQPSVAYLSLIAQFVGSFEPETKSFSISAMHSQPVSRGTVHIQSSNPADAPSINPNFLSNPLDLEIFAENMLQIETLIRESPLNTLIKQPIVHRDPDSNLTNLETAKNWIRKNGSSMWHYVGTCAMLPKELNGVVDPNLKVYGTHGLRIVDSSAIPAISTANLQSTVYAFAERAADLIKQEEGKPYQA